MKKLLACVLACTGILLQAQVVTQTLNYTGSVQTFTVPACVNVMSFTCFGAQGANGSTSPAQASGGAGGLGGLVYGTTTVTPGSVIYINIGGTATGSLGGFNGGGNGGLNNSGGGGGATDIRFGGNTLANRVLVAGGGGGGGNGGCYLTVIYGGAGGAGGGGNGSQGLTFHGGGGTGGSGVNQGLPGSGCYPGQAGTSGTLGAGGNGGNGGYGGNVPNFCPFSSSGGGGGGGYYGGGGGGGATVGNFACVATGQGGGGGGAGGANYVDPAFSSTLANNGVRAGNGQVILSFTPLPVLTLTPLTPTVCVNSSVALNVSGATNYTWSTGSTTFSTSVSPTSNTTYTVNGSTTSTLGTCTGSATISVTVVALPVVSVNSGSICSGTTFTMIPNGASTYTFEGGSAVVSPTSNTTYTVQGTDTQGCRSPLAAASVTVHALPVISVNSGTVCPGTPFTLSPSGASTYTYLNGGPVFSPALAGTYSVSGTSSVGCVSQSPGVASISLFTLPIISVNSGTLCSGTNFTMTPNGASTYTFQGGSAVVSPTSNATYTVRGTSAQGCGSASFATASVTVVALPVISVNSGTVCPGTPFTLTPSGASTYTYVNGGPIVSPTLAGTYSVSGTSSLGCVSQSPAVANISLFPVPVVSVNSGTICYGTNFTMTPNGASTYTFQGGSAVVSPTNNATYTVIGTNTLGCRSASFAIASVTVYSLPVISVNGGTVCPGSPFTLTPSGASTYTYLNGGPLVSPTVAGTYSVSGTSSLGCVSQSPAVASISLFPLPVISVNSGTLCYGTSFTLSPFGASSYTYMNGGPVVSPSVTTTHSVLGSSAEGCLSASYGLAQVDVLPAPTITVTSGAICPGDVFTLMAQGAVSYTYEGGNPAVSPLTTTSYTVIGTDTLGCESVVPAVATVTVLDVPSVLIVGATTVCAGQDLTLSALGATSYTWSTGSNSTTIVVSPQTNTIYSVSGEVPDKLCVGKDTLSVTMYACTALHGLDAALNGLLLYPNPAGNRLTVELPRAGLKQVSVSDATGRKVTELDSSEEKFDLDLSTLSPGLYLVRVDCDGSSATVRIVRQ